MVRNGVPSASLPVIVELPDTVDDMVTERTLPSSTWRTKSE